MLVALRHVEPDRGGDRLTAQHAHLRRDHAGGAVRAGGDQLAHPVEAHVVGPPRDVHREDPPVLTGLEIGNPVRALHVARQTLRSQVGGRDPGLDVGPPVGGLPVADLGLRREELVELVAPAVVERDHEAVRRQRAGDPGRLPRPLLLRLRRPEHDVAAAGGGPQVVDEIGDVPVDAVELVDDRLRDVAVLLPSRRVGGDAVGVRVLVEQDLAHHVAVVDPLPVHLDGPRDLDQRLQRERVESDHAVDVLTRLRLPHPRGERGGLRELGRHREVAPLLRGLEPPPVARVVAGHRDRAGRQREVGHRGHVTERERAVLHREDAGGEQHPGTRPHLAVVGREQQVPRPLGHLGDAGRRVGDIVHRGPGLAQLAGELRPRVRERADQRFTRPESDGIELLRRIGADRAEPLHEGDPLGPGLRGRVELGARPVHRVHTDVHDGRRAVGERPDRPHLAPDPGHHGEGRDGGRAGGGRRLVELHLGPPQLRQVLAADQGGRVELLLGGLELVEPLLGVPAGRHQLHARRTRPTRPARSPHRGRSTAHDGGDGARARRDPPPARVRSP